jgi:hypothetical protein
MTATDTQTNSANHELWVSQSLRIIKPCISMNKTVAMLKTTANRQFVSAIVKLFSQFYFDSSTKLFSHCRLHLLVFLGVKLQGTNCAVAESKARPHYAAVHA